ncbi:MAG TPA: molybdopterin cofactor-binding domain-containing protein, partial [Rhodothermia bacterium]
ITGFDAGGAESVDGVVGILTASDIPGENQVGPIIADELLLAQSEVHFIGQPIALVVAESRTSARRAADQVRISYERHPVIVDPREAFRAGHIIGATRTFEMGDVDAAWSGCDVIVEGTCETGGQEHVYLETHRARAVPLEGGRMRVFSSTQGPYAAQKGIARILNLRNHDVEVEVARIGGGFGGKEDQSTIWACLAALGAWKTGRPVELVLRRAQDMYMTGKRHPYSSDFKLGATSDGRLIAFDARYLQNAGATADLSPAVLERTLFHGTNSYFIPNVRLFGASCRTNLPPNTAFRGFGGPQGMFVIESALTKLADAIGVSREVIQRRNLIRNGDVFPYGQELTDARAERTWDQAVESYGLPAILADRDDHNWRHPTLKKGVAVMPVCFGISFTTTRLNQASALVHVYTDGSVAVSTGGIEMGQGLSTNIAQIAARGLGIDEALIRVQTTNTTRVANMSASAASSTTVLNGNATLAATRQILRRLAPVAREVLGCSSETAIEIEGDRVISGGVDTGMTWKELVAAAYERRVGLSAYGHFATPDIHFDKKKEKGRPFAYHTYGTAIVEVTVDCLRGVYEIDSVKIVHDLGRPLNLEIDLGQVEGGLAQGLGWMTVEDLQYNADGRLLSSALATYKVPDVYFMPDDIRVEFLEDADEPIGPFGNKAVGEPPLMYGIGVWFAIRDAIRAFRPDVDIPYSSPMTPERLLMTLYPQTTTSASAVEAGSSGEIVKG